MIEDEKKEVKPAAVDAVNGETAEVTDEKKADEILEKIGWEITSSAYFQEAMRQPHHGLTTVGEHTLAVTRQAVLMHLVMKRRGIHSDLRSIVIGALCHDLGILGRERKFRHNRECCSRHPVDSVKIAKKLFPHLDRKTGDVIRYHMWPATLHPPVSREGFIVSAADKAVSMRDARKILKSSARRKMQSLRALMPQFGQVNK